MKRKIALTLAVVLAAIFVSSPIQGQAATQLDKINKQIKELQKEMNRKAQEKQNAEKSAQVASNRKKTTLEEIQAINAQIEEVGAQLTETERQISQTEDELQTAGQQLEESMQQEAATGDRLDDRIRLMYTNGNVSYLDVLLSATSFSDFLGRFDAMQSITVQTRDLLEEHQILRAQNEQAKNEIANDLRDLQALYEQKADKKADLESKEDAKAIMVAQFDQQIDNFGEISEESEKALMELAKKMAKLQAEKERIKTYYKGGKLGVPLKSYTLSSSFGYRIHPISKTKKLHTGMDMAAPSGTPIYAAESGRVIVSQWWSGYGNCIIIDHGGGIWTLYGHIKNGGLLVEKGDNVKRGQKIALVGSTGQSTGPHLHFEVRKNSEPVNPAPYLK